MSESKEKESIVIRDESSPLGIVECILQNSHFDLNMKFFRITGIFLVKSGSKGSHNIH